MLYADVIFFFCNKETSKNPLKIVNIDGESLEERLEEFQSNKIFRKDVTNDNIKSHKKPEVHLLEDTFLRGLANCNPLIRTHTCTYTLNDPHALICALPITSSSFFNE